MTLEGAVAASHAAIDEGPDAVVSGLTGDDRSMLSNMEQSSVHGMGLVRGSLKGNTPASRLDIEMYGFN